MLTVNYNTTDLSIKLEEYDLPAVTITLLASEKIYVGYYKPISNIYIELATTVVSLSNLAIEYETLAGVMAVENLIDRTNGLGNSGRVQWDLPSDAIVTTKFGKELYWYEFSVNVATVAMGYVGINVLFSDDKDLIEIVPNIMEQLPTGSTSFVNFHSLARKDIVQTLRKAHSANSKLLTQYDLLNNEEVKQASKYLTLSHIYNWLSDAPEDIWSIKATRFYNKHADFLNSYEPTIDENDNGQIDEEEKSAITYVRLVRV